MENIKLSSYMDKHGVLYCGAPKWFSLAVNDVLANPLTKLNTNNKNNGSNYLASLLILKSTLYIEKDLSQSKGGTFKHFNRFLSDIKRDQELRYSTDLTNSQLFDWANHYMMYNDFVKDVYNEIEQSKDPLYVIRQYYYFWEIKVIELFFNCLIDRLDQFEVVKVKVIIDSKEFEVEIPKINAYNENNENIAIQSIVNHLNSEFNIKAMV